MKISKKQVIFYAVAILIVLSSVAFLLCDCLIPLNIWTHPVLNFLFFICLGFGIEVFVYGFINKSPWFIFVSSLLLGLTLIYLLAHYIAWWIGLIVIVSIWVVIAFINIIFIGNKTENIALNSSDDYVPYKDRIKQDKEEKPEDLPQIKSFKD